ncbi:hypothetical protein BSK56_08605 [Paenibacillus borealis]|uniref:Peptidase M56 domain-containing protein n=1 Tax=Paenibacillus borealis TaxID=160799 RepID=A0ABX3HKK5_PAEBO|nr:hypothetical protein BSK56_08605 [Paenibacillus borealis]
MYCDIKLKLAFCVKTSILILYSERVQHELIHLKLRNKGEFSFIIERKFAFIYFWAFHKSVLDL